VVFSIIFSFVSVICVYGFAFMEDSQIFHFDLLFAPIWAEGGSYVMSEHTIQLSLFSKTNAHFAFKDQCGLAGGDT